MNEPRHCLGCTGWHLGPIAASIAADTVETHEPCPGLSDNTEAVERRLEEVSRAANLFHEFKDVRVMWANGEVCDSCSHALCTRIRIVEAERDRLREQLNAESDVQYAQRQELDGLREQLAAARAELETERMRLAACSVAALGNTETSRAQRITRENPYWSASYGDVCDAVDREMALREQLAAAQARIAALENSDRLHRHHTLVGPVTDCDCPSCQLHAVYGRQITALEQTLRDIGKIVPCFDAKGTAT